MSWRTFAGSLVGVAFFLVIYSWTWYTSGDYYDYYYGDGRDSYSTSSYYTESSYSPGGPDSDYASPADDYSSPTSGYSNPGDYSTGTTSSYSSGPYESTTNSFSDDAAPPAEPSPSEFPSSSLYEPN